MVDDVGAAAALLPVSEGEVPGELLELPLQVVLGPPLTLSAQGFASLVPRKNYIHSALSTYEHDTFKNLTIYALAFVVVECTE